MNFKKCLRIAVVVFAISFAAHAEPSLTIYNQNFAVVRQPLPLDLRKGTNEVRVTDITAHMEADSVILRDPTGKRAIQILEQNYRADPVSQGLLLSLYEGKEIRFLVRKQDKDEIVRGRIVRSGYVPHQSGMQRYGQQYRASQMAYASGPSGQPIIEVDGALRFSLPGEPLFPALADDTILKPTLHWLLETDRAGKLDAELSYVTGGMSWKADYSMLAQDNSNKIDVIGWVTVDNQSGRTFENAKIKLMAGDVSKIQQQPGVMYEMSAMSGRAMDMSMPAAVTEKAFEDYHLYTLNRKTTLHDRETKQVEFLRANSVKAEGIYVYDGAKIDWNRYRGWDPESLRRDRNYGTDCNPKVWIMKEFVNSQENHLGMPLPRGIVRFYRRDDDGQLEFTGENIIDHTPKDETVRVYTGNAFDLVGERKRTQYQIDTSRDWLDESFEIKVRNRKDKDAVEIRVVEHLYRWLGWEIVQKSDDFTKTESQTIEFRVKLEPGQEKTITYKVHYTW
ncbi:MAG TPA: DUF4139 domain-containing protein [Sedimentisphaerales bacterium]|nr:DUF4139 domain-containing protein [Sedimentisphaerales bacterium]